MPTDDRECAIEWIVGQRTCTVTLWTGRLQNRVLSLCKKYPGQAKILAVPEQNGGFLYARIPLRWLKINSPTREMTEEEKEAARERLASVRGRK